MVWTIVLTTLRGTTAANPALVVSVAELHHRRSLAQLVQLEVMGHGHQVGARF